VKNHLQSQSQRSRAIGLREVLLGRHGVPQLIDITPSELSSWSCLDTACGACAWEKAGPLLAKPFSSARGFTSSSHQLKSHHHCESVCVTCS